MAKFGTGQSVRRVEDQRFITGSGRYTDDINLPGQAYGYALRSPEAHARIVRIDTSAARDLPGVHAVLTGADVPGHRFGRTLKDVPILASDRVRYAGERVAVVAADDEDIAQQALDLIEVEYEELPAVLDPFEAMKDGAPIIHPDFNSYVGFRQKMEA
ncbi:MAG: xanthine dehydrogenase family protein molybdopterin-binding subunit, partial [Geminicoccales bacterium]